MNCSLCYSENFKRYSLDQPVFRHQDFEKIGTGIELFNCLNCGLIYQNKDSPYLEESEKEFKEPAYAKSGQTGNIQSLDGNTENRRVDFQGEFLVNHVLSELDNPSILDLGAFDGTLLKILSEKIQGDMLAYDVNESLESFYEGSGIIYTTSKEECESRKYDLIITSQSLMYFSDLHFVKRLFKKCLKVDGKIFIQVPEVLENPCAITLADQRSFFTRVSLRKLATTLGLECTYFEDLQPKKEIVCLLRPGDGFENQDESIESQDLNLIVKILEEKREIVKKINEKVYILGTTINASWVGASIDEDKVAGFFDEDPSKKNRTLLGKKIFSNLSSVDETLLVPYPDQSKSLFKKFSKDFNKVISLF